jgi:hypothetical protein
VVIFAPGVEGLEISYSEALSEDLRGVDFIRCPWSNESVVSLYSYGPFRLV